MVMPEHQKFVYQSPKDGDLVWTCKGCYDEKSEVEEPAYYGYFSGQPYCKDCAASMPGGKAARMEPPR